ncbi:MAG: hypothetical protein ACR2L2_09275 [Acidobacteriota bacterium]
MKQFSSTRGKGSGVGGQGSASRQTAAGSRQLIDCIFVSGMLWFVGAVMVFGGGAQTQSSSSLSAAQLGQQVDVPPAQRLRAGFTVVWTEVERAYEDLGLPRDESITTQGKVISQFKEFISGPTTAAELDKIAVRPKTSGGSWVRVRFRMETEVELIEKLETLVRATAIIEGLRRDFRGKDEWMQLPSRGELEAAVLTRVGRNLFGDLYQIEWPRKGGFWNRAPQAVPDTGLPRDPMPKPDRDQQPRKPPPMGPQ